MKRYSLRVSNTGVGRRILATALTAALLLLLVSGCGAKYGGSLNGSNGNMDGSPSAEPMARMSLLDFSGLEGEGVTPSVPAYQVNSDLSNVMNISRFYLTDGEMAKLAENLFVVTPSYANEFFETYENNRYYQLPNFITVDSMMHTYHLYFSLLLNRTEKNYLSVDLASLSRAMLETAQQYYDVLKGTGWEEAALRNVAFFAVGAKLQDDSVTIPDCAAEIADAELQQISGAQGIGLSPLTEDYMDYTQYIPRGYYAGDPVLEAYFRAMMWYGQVNFSQENYTLTRAALLTTLTLASSD